jgi:hypothetical protein
MEHPSFAARPPSSYLVSVEHRRALLEGEISLGRLVDMASLKGEFTWRGTPGELRSDRPAKETIISAVAGENRCSFECPLVNYFLASPMPVTRMREFLLEFAPTALDLVVDAGDEPAPSLRALGDEIRYVTVHR